jgi:hypothetical protein
MRARGDYKHRLRAGAFDLGRELREIGFCAIVFTDELGRKFDRFEAGFETVETVRAKRVIHMQYADAGDANRAQQRDALFGFALIG